MKKILSPVFNAITDSEFEEMKKAFCLKEKSYSKNEYVFRMGDATTALAVVVSGSVVIENTDVWGNASVITKVRPGGVFAETYAICRAPLMVEARALQDSRILFIDLEVLEAAGKADPPWHRKMTKNLLDISAKKNITLSERMFCISSKTVRGRVLAFLSMQARFADSERFSIPFDRQQMADYLNVDRSALSKELGKMKNEGLIDYHKNEFALHFPDF